MENLDRKFWEGFVSWPSSGVPGGSIGKVYLFQSEYSLPLRHKDQSPLVQVNQGYGNEDLHNEDLLTSQTHFATSLTAKRNLTCKKDTLLC